MSKTNTKSADKAIPLKTGPLDVFKYRWVYLGISLLFLLPGIYFLIANMMDPAIDAPLRLGIDFKGGTIVEYGFHKPVTQSNVNDIRAVFDKEGYTGSVIQIQEPRVGINKEAVEIGAPAPGSEKPATTPDKTTLQSETTAATKAPEATETSAATAESADEHIATIVSVRTKHLDGPSEEIINKDHAILQDLQSQFGPITVLQKNSIGPALAKELLVNGLLALVLAYILIVGYLTFRFEFDFAICAMIALIHDTLFLFGMFAIFGKFFHTEIDSLFVTAVLTAVGFSVHDTIVVFDRIRENGRVYFTKKVPFVDIVNMSVNQTLARSINTSLTALLTLAAMYLWGGETTRDFVLAIILGISAGTYSSIFNASVLLAMWRQRHAAPAKAVVSA